MDIIIKLTQDYSSPVKFWLGNKLIIGIYEPDQLQVILHNSVDKSIIYKLIEPILGKGLVTAPVPIWRKHRKAIALNFNTLILRNLSDTFVDQSLSLTKELKRIGLNGKEINLSHYIFKYTLNVICVTMTNIKPEFFSNQINQYLEIRESITKMATLRLRNVFLYSDFIFNLTAAGRKQKENINFLHSFIETLIQQHLINAQNNINNDKTFLDTLIKMFDNEKCPQEVIRENLLTIILAGSDTTAVTLDFAIFMLALHPHIQNEVYKEIKKICGTDPVKYEDVHYMKYLDCVIKETMRLFPAIPLIGRSLTKDVKIGDTILPKGTDVILVIIALHRNEKFWKNALTFDPDRFLPDKIEMSQKHYMPFSYGERNCIGKGFALLSMKILLATLICNFIFEADSNIKINEIRLNMNISLSSVKPLSVKLKTRGPQ